MDVRVCVNASARISFVRSLEWWTKIDFSNFRSWYSLAGFCALATFHIIQNIVQLLFFFRGFESASDKGDDFILSCITSVILFLFFSLDQPGNSKRPHGFILVLLLSTDPVSFREFSHFLSFFLGEGSVFVVETISLREPT